MMQLFDLTGRVAIVTGGNGGIGLGMAQGLAAAGATAPLSPTPLTPSSLMTDGELTRAIAMGGRSSAFGIA